MSFKHVSVGLALSAEALAFGMGGETAQAANNNCVYIVQPGDSEFSISQATGVSQKGLAQENGYTKGHAVLNAGDLIDFCLNGVDDTKNSSGQTTVNHSAAAPTTLPASTSEGCPTSISNLGEVSGTCLDAAKTLLRKYGFTDDSFTRALKAYQIEAGVVAKGGQGYGNLGPKTYSSIMSGSGMQTIRSQAELSNGIVVDKSDQTLKYFKNGTLVAADLISTGLSISGENRETRTGSHKVDRKKSGWVVSSLQTPGADPAMGDPFYFDGGQAIHATPASQESKLGSKASHGCVRTAENFQQDLIAQGIGIGTLVRIQE